MDHDVNRFDQVILAGGEPCWSEHSGTKALMMAVLEDGIRDYCGAAGLRRTEAEHWVWSKHRGIFSFTVVCETLGLEPTAVRLALVRLREQSGFPSGRIRPTPTKNRSTAQLR